MPSLTIVEYFNIFKNGMQSILVTCISFMINQFSFHNCEKRFSYRIMPRGQASRSQQSPLRDMLWINSCLLSSLRKSVHAYWTPRSEWNVSPLPGRRLLIARLRAVTTISWLSELLNAQPITIRENRSITTVKYSQCGWPNT